MKRSMSFMLELITAWQLSFGTVFGKILRVFAEKGDLSLEENYKTSQVLHFSNYQIPMVSRNWYTFI